MLGVGGGLRFTGAALSGAVAVPRRRSAEGFLLYLQRDGHGGCPQRQMTVRWSTSHETYETKIINDG